MEKTPQRLLAWGLLLVLLGVALYFIFPWLAPFLLALAISALIEPLVLWLMKTLHLPRYGAAALCVVTLLALLTVGGGVAAVRGGYELSKLMERLPRLLSVLPAWGENLYGQLNRLIALLPESIQHLAKEAASDLLRQGLIAPHTLKNWLTESVTALVAALPSVMLFAFTAVLATYFSSAHRPALLTFLRHQVPRPWRPKLREIRRRLGKALGGWLKTQGILMLITFAVLTVGLLFLRVDMAMLIAAGTAFLDALPVFGTGIVLIPWALVSLLTGDIQRGVMLAVLYGFLWLLRSLLEPKLVGDRVGLHPLAALFFMYGGYRFFGVWGMIFAPLVGIMAKQLHDCGLLRLWRE